MLEEKVQDKGENSLQILDVTKYVCALLVIIIHTSPLEPYSQVANFYIRDVLARMAVPMFFAISGFLFSRKGNLKRTLLRTIMLYVCCSVFYLIIQIPQWYAAGWWGLHVVKDYVVALISKGSYYHLWYILATIYAYPLLAGIIKKTICSSYADCLCFAVDGRMFHLFLFMDWY